MPLCTQEFFERWFSDGLTAEAFARAPCLAYNLHDRLQIEFVAQTCGAAILPPSHYIADARALAEAAQAGMGWVMLPHLIAQPLINDGRLVLFSRDNHYFSTLTWQVARATQGIMHPVTLAVRDTASRLLVQTSQLMPPVQPNAPALEHDGVQSPPS